MKEIGSITDELVRLSRAGFPLIEIDDEFNFVWNPTSRIARSSKFILRGTGGKEAFVYDPHTDTITLTAGVVGIPSSVTITDLTVTDLIPYAGNLLTVDGTGLFIDGGIAISDLYTATQLDAGQLDTRYYTESELDAGQLDNRYYTETEVDNTIASLGNVYLSLGGGALIGSLFGISVSLSSTLTAASLFANTVSVSNMQVSIFAQIAKLRATTIEEVEVTTSGTANVDIETATIVRQTASAATTFTNVSTGSSITIVNDSLSINTITNQLWGETNWLLYPEESVTLYYDGAEFKTK
jgi:hypothetical protein